MDLQFSGLAVVVIAAFIIETIVEILKPLTKELDYWLMARGVEFGSGTRSSYVLSLVLGLAASAVWGLNLFELSGVAGTGALGCIATGFLMARGSNFVHNMAGKGKLDVGDIIGGVGGLLTQIGEAQLLLEEEEKETNK